MDRAGLPLTGSWLVTEGAESTGQAFNTEARRHGSKNSIPTLTFPSSSKTNDIAVAHDSHSPAALLTTPAQYARTEIDDLAYDSALHQSERRS